MSFAILLLGNKTYCAVAYQMELTALFEAWRQAKEGDRNITVLIGGAEFLFASY
jgi:hypothetical protein